MTATAMMIEHTTAVLQCMLADGSSPGVGRGTGLQSCSGRIAVLLEVSCGRSAQGACTYSIRSSWQRLHEAALLIGMRRTSESESNRGEIS
eukprot:5080058-Amphidinium_carterae.2